MYSSKIFDLVHKKSLDLEYNTLENVEFYTDCFEKDGTMKQVYEMFSKEPTTEAKFMYVYNLLKTNKKLPVENNMTNTKNDMEARELRIQANKHFNSENFIKALQGYNSSVMVAVVGNIDYALAVANRSAALYNLQKYSACLDDIHYALTNKYPSQLAYKLYEREIKCLVKIGKTSQAKFKFKEFLSNLASTLLTNEVKTKIKNELLLFLHKSEREKKHDNHTDSKNIITLLGGSKKNIPALSKFVNIQYSESMGRSLFVSTDIHPGDVLAIEKSYAGVLDYSSFTINCRSCFKHCINGIPCLKCTWVIYCDETCRIKSYENGHKYECEILNGFLYTPSITNMHYLSFYIVLMSISKLGLDKYIDIVNVLNANSDPLMKGFNACGQYLSEEFNSVYALEGNETKRTSSYLFTKHCYAAVIVSYLILAGIEIPDHQLGKIGESVVHILCVVISNAHGTKQFLTYGTPVPSIESYTPCAHLLLPVLSLINHNCDPNVTRQDIGGTVVIRALQPIKKGSEIFDNYGFLYATHVKELRQTKLLSQYCFHCQCLSCIENWPLFTQLSDSNDICTSSTYFIKAKKKLANLVMKLKQGTDDGINSLKFLYSHLEFLHNNMKKPCIQYCIVQETIKEIYSRTSNKHICY